MKRLILCHVQIGPRKNNNEDKIICESAESGIKISKYPVKYPINAFLAENIEKGDELKYVTIGKEDEYYKDQIEQLQAEVNEMAEKAGVSVEYSELIRKDEARETYNHMIFELLEELETNAHISVDMTFGSKVVPILLFSVLNIAEKSYDCSIDNILYGDVVWKKDATDKRYPEKSIVREMVPLYYLDSVAHSLVKGKPDDIKALLREILEQ